MKLIISLLLIIPSLSWGGNLITLNTYMLQNPNVGDNESLYISSRCAALFWHAKELNKNREDLYQNLSFSQMNFYELSIQLMGRILPNENFDTLAQKSANTINGMIDNYIEISNDHYLKTGEYFNENLWSDFDICSGILK